MKKEDVNARKGVDVTQQTGIPALEPCPCGKTPKHLFIADAGQGGKWAYASGECCGDWMIEFRVDYHELDSAECIVLAHEAWNLMPRAQAQTVTDVRSPKDYAIEHAEYMAQVAEKLLDCCNALSDIDECVIRVDDEYTDLVHGLRDSIFEFRKRKDRALLSAQAQPSDKSKEARLLRAVHTICNQSGESVDDFVDFLCEQGGLTKMCLVYFTKPQAQPVQEQSPLITVEASLRFQLECAEHKLKQAEDENRELRGKLQPVQAVPDGKKEIKEKLFDELLYSVKNLIDVKGRHHTEKAYQRLMRAYDAFTY